LGRAARKTETAVSNLSYLKEVFETEKGKNLLYDMCKKFHYFDSSYQGNVNDMLFREGERNVINYIMLQLKQNPAKILDEFRKRQQQEMEYED